MPGISVWQLLILLLVVVVLFGTKRLRNLGGDLSTAIRDFRKGLSDEDEKDQSKPAERLEADADNPVGSESERDKEASKRS